MINNFQGINNFRLLCIFHFNFNKFHHSVKAKLLSAFAITIALSACGGGSPDVPNNQAFSTASSATGSSSAASTSGTSGSSSNTTSTNTPSTPLITLRNQSESQALLLLTEAAKKKIGPEFLSRIFREEKTDFLIEFVNDVPLNLDPTQAALKFVEIKNAVFAVFLASDYVLLKDYSALPMSFIRTNDRTTLVNFLNHNGVKAIYENVTYVLN